MAINKEGNAYTFGFAFVMVVVVGSVLAFTAKTLKPIQDANLKQEKMKNILMSFGAMTKESNMKDAEAMFTQMLKEEVVLNFTGQPKQGIKAFDVDVKKQYKTLDKEDRDYPLFICNDGTNDFYIIPMVGTGLWGPVWGYVALESDKKTVAGATFDHKTETPGLGAEINNYEKFQKQFEGEVIFDESGKFTTIKVVKGGADPADKSGVNAITGGTITSDGVGEMLKRTLKTYAAYLKK